jgi:hypothetical protein
MSVDKKRRQLDELKSQVAKLEGELTAGETVAPFQPTGYYTAYYATMGFMLGIFGALASLIFNVVGSLIVGQYPLELIRVYLTFPLGDRALDLQSGLALAVGCCLYIGTGMLLGIPFHLAISRFADQSSFAVKLALVTVLSLAVWLINFYCILSWLQPALIDMSEKNLIVNKIPVWVAALTHLVFGWTMVIVYPLGRFSPYRRVTEQA